MKDFAAKPIAKDMAHKPRQTRRWLYVVAGICAAVAICGTWGAVLNAIAPIPLAQDTDDTVATGLPALEEAAAAWQGELHTNTPEPSVTANPSRTPHPTFTPLPSSTPLPNEVVVYVDREVTREVEITSTPEPVTPMPTPSLTATVPLWLQEQHQKTEARMMWRGIGMRLAEFFISPWFVFFVMVVAVCYTLLRYANRMIDRAKVRVTGPTPAVGEIGEEIPVNDWRDERNRLRVMRLREQGANLLQIEERIWPHDQTRGGAHYRFIKDVLRQYDPLGEHGPTTPPHHPPTA